MLATSSRFIRRCSWPVYGGTSGHLIDGE